MSDMELDEALFLSNQAVTLECKRLGWKRTRDLQQEAQIKVWISRTKDGALIRAIARSVVVDDMRSKIRRSKIKIQFVPLTERDADTIPDNKVVTQRCSQTLDTIEETLDSEERLLFRHLRMGHNAVMIAKSLSIPISTCRRLINELIEKARGILNE